MISVNTGRSFVHCIKLVCKHKIVLTIKTCKIPDQTEGQNPSLHQLKIQSHRSEYTKWTWYEDVGHCAVWKEIISILYNIVPCSYTWTVLMNLEFYFTQMYNYTDMLKACCVKPPLISSRRLYSWLAGVIHLLYIKFSYDDISTSNIRNWMCQRHSQHISWEDYIDM